MTTEGPNSGKREASPKAESDTRGLLPAMIEAGGRVITAILGRKTSSGDDAATGTAKRHTARNVGVGLLVTILGGLVILAIQTYVGRQPIYRQDRTEHCGPERFAQGTGPVCGTVFNARRDRVCGVELYNLGQGPECGVDKDPKHWVALTSIDYPGSGHKTNYCRDRGYAGHNGRKPNGHCYPYHKCRNEAYGVDRHLLCRRESFGVERYESCRDESFGVEAWKQCRHEAHGIERYRY